MSAPFAKKWCLFPKKLSTTAETTYYVEASPATTREKKPPENLFLKLSGGVVLL
jgi:hypothetical protein